MLKKYLLAPGPTPVPPEVLLAMAQPIIHHRTPQFEAVFAEVQAGLQRLFQTREDVLILASSGTGAMEAAVTNTTSPGDHVIVVNGGKFGERWTKIATAYGLAVTELKVEWGRAVENAKTPHFYFDLTRERENQQKHTTAWTPAISLVSGTHAALQLIFAEELANVFARHARLARATRAAAQALGLRLVAPECA